MTRDFTLDLDANATSGLDPEVLAEMQPYLSGFAGNPSSRHAIGQRARRAIDEAARRIAQALGADVEQILFVSGATEANNLAIAGAALTSGDHLLVSPSEHPSALEPAKAWSKQGVVVEELSLDPDGQIVDLPEKLRPETKLVVAQLANSETGAIQPIAALAKALPAGCRFHCDAVQAIGRVPVNFRELGVTSLSLSGHKIHGPPGVGALIQAKGFAPRPLFRGGHQQRDLRPGTEPVPLIVGLGKAVELAVRRQADGAANLASLRDRLENQLAALVPNIVFNRPKDRLPNTTNVSFLGAKAEAVVIALDMDGICCSAGTACASGSLEPSAALRAMGIEGERLTSAIRCCLPREVTAVQIDEAARRIAAGVERVRQALNPRGIASARNSP